MVGSQLNGRGKGCEVGDGTLSSLDTKGKYHDSITDQEISQTIRPRNLIFCFLNKRLSSRFLKATVVFIALGGRRRLVTVTIKEEMLSSHSSHQWRRGGSVAPYLFRERLHFYLILAA
ncbi:hypothetical protein AVEN_198161-1 [Araneus ventricosus]|uniref:Uncharacterized protein n=1 Tax=Araneus ventricosus TaxID=182803 RepID=A0A4Y2GIJ3_ARAVE|nr:hypothetical protein AVEN_198161-1 [Araneus ventricosus]